MIVALAMSSCELFNVDVDTEVGGALQIEVADNMAKASEDFPYSFDESTDLDPNSDEVEKYKDNIVDAEVGSITAEIIVVTKEGVVIEKDAEFIVTDSDDVEHKWILPEDWAIVLGETRIIENQGTFYEDVSAILKDVEIFEIRLKGDSNTPDVYFEIYFNIVATVTGSIF